MLMMLLNSLSNWVRKRTFEETLAPRPSTRLRLEELEDRVVPSFVGTADTYTNASVQIAPNLGSMSVTETVTATVSTVNFDPFTGMSTTIPSGAGNNATGGKVLFNLNNQQATATVNSNGQATATFTVPLLAFLTSQTLELSYQGFAPDAGSNYRSSSFLAPLYKNFDNVFLPSTLTFNQLTPQQTQFSTTTLSSFYTAQGETDSVFNGLIKFNYVDPGTIDTVSVLSFNLPGVFALQLGAYNGLSSSSSSTIL
jgi:hypothetical protein